MIALRAALDDAEHALLSARIAGLLQETLPRPVVCGFCWPIHREPDVRAAVRAWCRLGTQAALPVVVEPGQPLRFRAWREDSRLVADRYGIPTPVDGECVHPDLLLMPLNGFDPAGFRLGYGGGYFDRTLAAMQPRPLAVGIGFEINRVDSIRPESHDQRLDWIVTETGAFRPAG